MNNNEALKALIDDFRTEYLNACKRSKDNYIKSLPKATSPPDEIKIYDDETYDKMLVFTDKLHNQLFEIFKPILSNKDDEKALELKLLRFDMLTYLRVPCSRIGINTNPLSDTASLSLKEHIDRLIKD